eukprot:1518760-Pleurochrysis_carterae.AAC.1
MQNALYELLQYRIARLHSGLAKRTQSNGGAVQLGSASLTGDSQSNLRHYAKRRIVPFVAGESDDGMAPLIHHCLSKY